MGGTGLQSLRRLTALGNDWATPWRRRVHGYLSFIVRGKQEPCGTAEDCRDVFSPSATQRAFPDRQYSPSVRPEMAYRAVVALDVSADLVLPELCPSFRPPKQMTLVAVPKAPMDEHHRLMPWEDQIGRSRDCRAMELEAEAAPVQAPSDNDLRLRVLASNSTHVEAPLLGCKIVSHRKLSSLRPGVNRRSALLSYTKPLRCSLTLGNLVPSTMMVCDGITGAMADRKAS